MRPLLGAAVAAAVVAIGAPAAAGDAPRFGGTVTIGADAEPACLSPVRLSCNQAWAHWSAGLAVAGAYRIRPDLSYEPVLVDSVDVQVSPFTLTYRIKPQAVWSDGTPVTADDFLFTAAVGADPSNSDVFRDGYDRIVEATKLDAKTARFVFSRPYAPWHELFSAVLPKHVLAAADLDTAWETSIADPSTGEPIGSGPFLVESWARGESLTLRRNPRWWGPHAPYLERVVVRFLPDANTQFEAIRSGAVEVLAPQPQLQVADLRQNPEVTVSAARGPSMEHLDFNVNSPTMPLLRETWFRQAVAQAIDRPAVASALYSTIDPTMDAHQSLVHLSAEASYRPDFARYAYDPAAVSSLMLAHGCVRGDDAIWSCGGVRASMRISTTAGNQLRELAEQQMVGQARAAGIELVVDNAAAGFLFGVRLPAFDWDLIMFTWIMGESSGRVSLYGCGGSMNTIGYCSPAATDLLERASSEVDATARAALLNEADAILAEDVPSLPLFLRPSFLVWRNSIHGPVTNATPQGPTWNIEDWWTELAPADTTPPVTTADASPAANASGWNAGPVRVDLAAEDPSGVDWVAYELAGAAPPVVVPGDRASVTIATEGTTLLRYWARDAAGNLEDPKTLVVRIDATPPVLTCAATPDRLWPPDGRLAPVDVSVSLTDSVSGAAGFTLAAAASDEPADGTIVGFELGTADTSGSLRAERAAGGDGRTYSLTYEARDVAGNASTCVARVVVPHDARPR